MGMPSGDSPQKAQQFYEYLLAHHETERPVQAWYVNWYSLAWVWGFVAALSVILIIITVLVLAVRSFVVRMRRAQ